MLCFPRLILDVIYKLRKDVTLSADDFNRNANDWSMCLRSLIMVQRLRKLTLYSMMHRWSCLVIQLLAHRWTWSPFQVSQPINCMNSDGCLLHFPWNFWCTEKGPQSIFDSGSWAVKQAFMGLTLHSNHSETGSVRHKAGTVRDRYRAIGDRR